MLLFNYSRSADPAGRQKKHVGLRYQFSEDFPTACVKISVGSGVLGIMEIPDIQQLYFEGSWDKSKNSFPLRIGINFQRSGHPGPKPLGLQLHGSWTLMVSSLGIIQIRNGYGILLQYITPKLIPGIRN